MRGLIFLAVLSIAAVPAVACDGVAAVAVAPHCASSQAFALGVQSYFVPQVAVQSFAVAPVIVQQRAIKQRVFIGGGASAAASAAGGASSAAASSSAASAAGVRGRSRASSGGIFGFGFVGPQRSRAVAVTR